jgi:hypothetical protein
MGLAGRRNIEQIGDARRQADKLRSVLAQVAGNPDRNDP